MVLKNFYKQKNNLKITTFQYVDISPQNKHKINIQKPSGKILIKNNH